MTLTMVGAWIGSLACQGAYKPGVLTGRVEEYRSIARAGINVTALLALGLVIAPGFVDRNVVAIGALSGLAMLFSERCVARCILNRQRKAGKWICRGLAVGDREHVAHLVSALRHSGKDAGLTLIGACTPNTSDDAVCGVPILGRISEALAVATRCHVDLVAVTAAPEMSSANVRGLRWALEDAGIRLLVVPPLTGVSRSRVSIVRAAEGVPVLQVSAPNSGIHREAIKGLTDRILAGIALVALSPLLAAVALLIRMDSRGPILFKQPRVGKNGALFPVWKFRTMVIEAESLVPALSTANESDGLLFKIKADPRVTPVGRWLRRWSIDEVPQLINVLVGNMSLVGPRPLPVSPDAFQGSERRRLLVKPGITGLWQIRGRSDTTWTEMVRLDLYYVDNRSFWLDISILWRTVLAVARSRGAY
jgi:exopolysaccharide biosynthesis polyprenyl glycosylphosphotransferase